MRIKFELILWAIVAIFASVMLMLLAGRCFAAGTLDVTAVSVADSDPPHVGQVLQVTLRLRYWEDGHPDPESPVIDQNFSAQYQSTAGQTVQERIAITRGIIFDQMQEAIDSWKFENQLLNHQYLDDAVTWIETNLTP